MFFLCIIISIDTETMHVKAANISILQGNELVANGGDTVTLTCVVNQAASPPQYVYWYHGKRVLNYDTWRGGLSVSLDRGPSSVSQLRITQVTAADGGNYSCVAIPAYADPANITLYVRGGHGSGGRADGDGEGGRGSAAMYGSGSLNVLSSRYVSCEMALFTALAVHFQCALASGDLCQLPVFRFPLILFFINILCRQAIHTAAEFFISLLR